jgi:hypothetical protein
LEGQDGERQDGQIWKDHVCNYASCHLLHIDGQVHLSLIIVPTRLCCMLCGQSMRVAIMLICDKCSKVGIWDVLHHHWKKYQSENGFGHGALCRPR